MTKIFWRVDYGGDLDRQYMLNERKLAWPRDISADDRRRLGKQMRVNHGVVLGKLRGKSGLVNAIGRITGIDKHPRKIYEISVEWQELPALYLKPESSGVRKWQKYPVFKFADAPAKRYNLAELLETHLGYIPLHNSTETSDTQPINDLVLAALSSIQKPYPPEITDIVCQTIESSNSLLKQYNAIVESCAHMQDGKGFVNSQIGWFVKQTLGFIKISEGNEATSSLIKTYSKLKPPNNFWQRMTVLEGRKLATLDQENPFEILTVSENHVIILISSSQEEYTIQRRALEGAWSDLVSGGSIERSEIEAEHSPRSSAYVAAILTELPEVRTTIRPIILHYDPS